MASDGSFTIEIMRAELEESGHRIHAVIADRAGAVRAWGEPLRPTLARSAIKSIQALPLVVTGAAPAFGLSREELALACASHSGEEEHVNAVLAWLRRLGLSENDLECGPDRPLGDEARRRFQRAGADRRPVFNCCSGKHTGFLTLARHLGYPTAGYIRRESPVQAEVTRAVGIMTGLDLSDRKSGIDGCGIPVFALPLERLAFAMARLVDPVDLPDDFAAAAPVLADAARHAFWVSGRGRIEMVVDAEAGEPMVIKTGAEGMIMVGLPERGLGIAIKAADGASRAAQAAVMALLRHLDVLPLRDGPVLIRNKAGDVSGETRAVIGAPVASRMAGPLQSMAAR